MKLGAVDFVQKPFFRDELLMRVRAAAERRQLARQVDLLQRQIRAGRLARDAHRRRAPPMAQVQELIGRAAPAAGTVLITGETGTGKELAARAIHACSPRAERPFVALNCAALTESLLENELFGHGKGAFTGAAAARPGLIEHASRRHAVPRRDRRRCRRRCRRSCCARSSPARCAASARTKAAASTSASSPRPTSI